MGREAYAVQEHGSSAMRAGVPTRLVASDGPPIYCTAAMDLTPAVSTAIARPSASRRRLFAVSIQTPVRGSPSRSKSLTRPQSCSGSRARAAAGRSVARASPHRALPTLQRRLHRPLGVPCRVRLQPLPSSSPFVLDGHRDSKSVRSSRLLPSDRAGDRPISARLPADRPAGPGSHRRNGTDRRARGIAPG